VTRVVEVAADPIVRFAEAVSRSRRGAPNDDLPMTVSTADASGRLSSRVVLLRQYDPRGFVFFTSYASRKARDLDQRPSCALTFYWPWIDEQVRVEGQAVRTSAEESDAYFASRPRGHQIGAWASRQSAVLESRAALELAYREVDAAYAGRLVPRPPFWGGYRVVPDRVEFWRAGADRLHDRLAYSRRDGKTWVVERLYP
jgi:pyridoxamine 5'-phosphate oxidase